MKRYLKKAQGSSKPTPVIRPPSYNRVPKFYRGVDILMDGVWQASTGLDILRSTDPFSDGSLMHKFVFDTALPTDIMSNGNLTDLVGNIEEKTYKVHNDVYGGDRVVVDKLESGYAWTDVIGNMTKWRGGLSITAAYIADFTGTGRNRPFDLYNAIPGYYLYVNVFSSYIQVKWPGIRVPSTYKFHINPGELVVCTLDLSNGIRFGEPTTITLTINGKVIVTDEVVPTVDAGTLSEPGLTPGLFGYTRPSEKTDNDHHTNNPLFLQVHNRVLTLEEHNVLYNQQHLQLSNTPEPISYISNEGKLLEVEVDDQGNIVELNYAEPAPVIAPRTMDIADTLTVSGLDISRTTDRCAVQGPIAYVSTHKNYWAHLLDFDNKSMEAEVTGIRILEDGLYEFEGAQRANGTGSAYIAISLNGNRNALQDTYGADDSNLYTHDHTETQHGWTKCLFVGELNKGDLICLGSPNTSYSSRLYYAASGPFGYLLGTRIK